MSQPTFNEDIQNTKIREAYLKERVKQAFGLDAVKSNMNQEFQGVDFTINNKTVDLKWTTTWRPTYAVELLYTNTRSQEKLGWFLDKSHQTDFCMLAEASQESYLLTAFLISLQEVRDYVGQFVTGNELITIAHDMKHKHERSYSIGKTGMKLVFSEHLRERPVNLVIPKSTYKGMNSYNDCCDWFGSIFDYNNFVKESKGKIA